MLLYVHTYTHTETHAWPLLCRCILAFLPFGEMSWCHRVRHIERQRRRNRAKSILHCWLCVDFHVKFEVRMHTRFTHDSAIALLPLCSTICTRTVLVWHYASVNTRRPVPERSKRQLLLVPLYVLPVSVPMTDVCTRIHIHSQNAHRTNT